MQSINKQRLKDSSRLNRLKSCVRKIDIDFKGIMSDTSKKEAF